MSKIQSAKEALTGLERAGLVKVKSQNVRGVQVKLYDAVTKEAFPGTVFVSWDELNMVVERELR